MHITKVELENIKSHTSSKFEFQRGTTAIVGANGAGKTTIIEAIAWTLFDLLDYKKDDFVKRGAKKGSVNVTFESSVDERQYTVYRDTGTGYYVYDPSIKARVADKKDEVSFFLRQHLGVEAGTDLDSLFRRAIGVPQGTFTAIFLESATERKKAFDKLLKVEEYRQGAEKLRETVKYLELQTNAVREKIARAEGELSRLEQLTAEHQEISTNIAEFEKVLAELKIEIEAKTKTVAELDSAEKLLNESRQKSEKLKFEFEAKEREKFRVEADFERAKVADKKIKAVQDEHLLHLNSLAELSKLEHQRSAQAKLNVEISRLETKIIHAKSEQKNTAESLLKAHEAKQQIALLEPQIKQQHELDKQKETLRNSLADANSVNKQIANLDRERNERRKIYTENHEKIVATEKKTGLAVNVQSLSLRDGEIVKSLAEFRANLERDEKFQREIQNGLCPILSQKCLNLKPGETLESFVTSQFDESKSAISTLVSEQKTVSAELKLAREAEKSLTALESYKQREKDIVEEGQRFKNEIETLQKTQANLPNLEKELAEVEAKLRELNNPREHSLAFQKEASREGEFFEKQREFEKILDELETERKILAENLEQFGEVEALFKSFQIERDRTANSHREFLANESLAKSLEMREKELHEIVAKIKDLQSESEKSVKEFVEFESKYNRELHLAERASLVNSQNRKAETNALCSASKKRETIVSVELARLADVREAMKAEFVEKERLEKLREATDFIRQTLKEAAPRVARNYVYHVSNEANQLFREITGNAERTLRWQEDYGIVLEEDGHDRPFLNLSGGEQMSAALSVRLALLKQLSDVRLAFFDEPTTNMDAKRRELLAEQISRITEKQSFDQLFVISHDDTFEEYVDNVVIVKDV